MTIELNEQFLQIKNFNLSYANQILFENFSLNFLVNKFNCLLGESGVGKSSLLNYLSSIDRISYLSQKDSLLPWLTVLENTVLVTRLKKFPTHEKNLLKQKAKHLLQKVGLQQALSLYPHQLSGGMRQRVALARTVLEEKPIVLLDEPFSSLDAITRFNLQTLTAELLKDKTVILVTHDPLEALRLADEIFILGEKPARIVKQISLEKSVTPRDPNDEIVMQWQGKLLHLLSEAHAGVNE